MGLGVAGFLCHEKHKNIKQDILNVYEYCHYKQITKDDLTRNFTKHNDKISLILDTCQSSPMRNLELMIYMKKILKYILQNSYATFYVARRIDDINFASQLLIYYHDVYFILSKNSIEHTNLCKLKKMMENDELRRLNIKDSIPGLNDKILKK